MSDLKVKSSVRVMLSYDYCHFEIVLSSEDDMDVDQIDEMRKDAMRLADKAVHQYKVAKESIEYSKYNTSSRKELERQVQVINENYPKSEWTEEQKATVKKLEDFRYYDYQDDWGDDDMPF